MNTLNFEKTKTFINELYLLIKQTQSPSLQKFCKEKGIPYKLIQFLLKEGIIRNEGKSKSTKWFWNTIDPNELMIKEAVRRFEKFTYYPKPSEKQSTKTDPITILKKENTKDDFQTEFDKEADSIRYLKNLGYKILKQTFVEV